MNAQTALITGAGRRIGAGIARCLHVAGYNVVLHYLHSETEAQTLADELNRARGDSARLIRADLRQCERLARLVEQAAGFWGGLNVLVNNASRFYPTALGEATEEQWDELLESNLKAPFFLSQAAVPWLRERGGVIVNIVDIHAERGLKGYPIYSISKAGLAAMTRALAKELGPEIRVNGVAPGAILWPERGMDAARQADILARIPLQRKGELDDVAQAVRFFVQDAPYVTGQILAVDGGRSLFT
jgi:pteridine reductase